MIILGIETSCDETSASIVQNGKNVLSNIIFSQIDIHKEYGGVVPELASRCHIETISLVVKKAISEANIKIDDIALVAVTQGPGLAGALLVGFSFAKAFAFSNKIPFMGVNHLLGHIYSIFLEEKKPNMPFVSLLVSGGHTNLYYVTSFENCELIGQTRDDAVGEAYDKVSKMLGLGYPGGVVIDRLSKECDKGEEVFFKRSYIDKKSFDFSFSGLKTGVLRYIEKNSNYKNQIPQIVSGFQNSAIDVLIHKLFTLAKLKNVKDISIVGGVAANSELRRRAKERAKKDGLNLYIPKISLCGDNAAMIAGVAYKLTSTRKLQTFNELDVFSR